MSKIREIATTIINGLIRESEKVNKFGYRLTEELFDPVNLGDIWKETFKDEPELHSMYEYRITIAFQNIELFKYSLIEIHTIEEMQRIVDVHPAALPHEFFNEKQLDSVWMTALSEIINTGISYKCMALKGIIVPAVKESDKPVVPNSTPIFGGESPLKIVN